jgi:hypothetical protein
VAVVHSKTTRVDAHSHDIKTLTVTFARSSALTSVFLCSRSLVDCYLSQRHGNVAAQSLDALCYKPESRGLDFE